MKIKKSKLLERMEVNEDAQEPELDEINPSAASIVEIADAIQNSIEEISDGESSVSDSSAEAAAKEIKAVADDIGASAVAVDDSIAQDSKEVLGVENRLTRLLDMALRTANSGRRQGQRKNANVLVTGLPGSGKTAIVFDWAYSKGINVYNVSATDPDLEASVYGLTLRDVTTSDQNKVTKATSNFLDALDRPNSVLFLDEFNRANSKLRRALLMLVNEHCINDQSYPNGLRPFPNLLFTVACVNPGGLRIDRNAEALNDAEKSRFALKLKDFDSDPETSLDYFTKHWDYQIRHLDPKDPDYMTDLEEYLRSQDMGNFIVSHDDFSYDKVSDLDDLYDLNRTMLNQRELTDGLEIAAGDLESLKDWVKYNSDFLGKDVEMLTDILDEYVKPNLDDLIKAKESELNIVLIPEHTDQPKQPSANAKPEEEEEIEDDETFFNDAEAGKSAASPRDIEKSINDVIARW